jgi:hypothetical protein
MPDQHEFTGFILEASPHGLDVIVRCDAGYLFYSFGRPKPRRQDFGCLFGARLFA